VRRLHRVSMLKMKGFLISFYIFLNERVLYLLVFGTPFPSVSLLSSELLWGSFVVSFLIEVLDASLFDMSFVGEF